MTSTRLSLFALLAAALATSAVVSAQPSSPERVVPSFFVGAWEGFDSDGVRLHLLFQRDQEAGPDVLEVGSTARPRGGELISSNAQYRVEPLSPETASLVPLGGTGSILVTFFSSEGMRLSWANGREAVLTRTLVEVPDLPPPSAFQMTFSTPIQARLLALSGDWYAHAPASEVGRSLRITIVDPSAGTLVIRQSRPQAPNLSAADARLARVTRCRDETVAFAFDDTGEELTIEWTSETEASLVAPEGGESIQLRRTPPEHE